MLKDSAMGAKERIDNKYWVQIFRQVQGAEKNLGAVLPRRAASPFLYIFADRHQ